MMVEGIRSIFKQFVFLHLDLATSTKERKICLDFVFFFIIRVHNSEIQDSNLISSKICSNMFSVIHFCLQQFVFFFFSSLTNLTIFDNFSLFFLHLVFILGNLFSSSISVLFASLQSKIFLLQYSTCALAINTFDTHNSTISQCYKHFNICSSLVSAIQNFDIFALTVIVFSTFSSCFNTYSSFRTFFNSYQAHSLCLQYHELRGILNLMGTQYLCRCNSLSRICLMWVYIRRGTIFPQYKKFFFCGFMCG